VNASRAIYISTEIGDFDDNHHMPAYNTCKFPYYRRDPGISDKEYGRLEQELFTYCLDRPEECKKGSQWLEVFQFNASVLFVTMVNFIILSFGGFFFCPRYFGTFFNLCYACCHCMACGAAIGVVANPLGRICAINIAPSTLEDGDWRDRKNWSDVTTYQSDAGSLIAMAITQLILWCMQCYCCCIPTLLTPRKEMDRSQASTVVNMALYPGMVQG